MSSGMTGQTPCLPSRWDQPAHPKQNVDLRQQRGSESSSHPVSVPGMSSDAAVSHPVQTPAEGPAPPGGVEMAAAMAAKINAMLMAKGKLLTLPPLLAKTPPVTAAAVITEELVVTEVDINDVPLNCRDLLTKGKTQEEIRQVSGAVVSTKGHYMSDAEKGTGAGQRPLYLHVQGKTQEQVNKAVMKIKEIISEDVLKASAASGGQQVPVMPPLTLYPQPPRPVVPPSAPRMPNASPVPGQGHRPAAPHSGSFVHTKIFVGMDQAPPSFNVNEKVEGPGGSYLSHIQTETGARVFLRGKGSGYIEQASKRESFEPLYVYISHPNAAGLEAAKKLTESLLETVRAEHGRIASMYSDSGSSTQSYAAHGFPPNSTYSSQGSWYNYPVNGYAGGYSVYPGAGGYWSNANGPPSHSNMSTNPPSSQAMVQYPVCPRKQHPYLVQGQGSGSDKVEPDTLGDAPPNSGSPKHHLHEGEKDQSLSSCSPDGLDPQQSPCPASSGAEERQAGRFLMPPPPPPPRVSTPPIGRKRLRGSEPEDGAVVAPVAVAPIATPFDVPEGTCEKKTKLDQDASVLVPYGEEDTSGLVPYGGEETSGLVPYGGEDTSGLVPYGGDSSSDEEEERTHSRKNDMS